MQYVVWGAAELPAELSRANGVQPLASGEMLVLEGPWPLGATALASCSNDAALASLPALPSAASGAFAVEGLNAPAGGACFVIAAHKMLDPEGFKPYAEAIPGMLESFGVRSLARGGKVTRLGGDFVPDRGVVLEFADVQAAVNFYTADAYRPLLELRLRTTDPRFVVLSRNGVIPKSAREKAEEFLRSRAKA
jgi:uncharacterized protein (DUF1330 family)